MLPQHLPLLVAPLHALDLEHGALLLGTLLEPLAPLRRALRHQPVGARLARGERHAARRLLRDLPLDVTAWALLERRRVRQAVLHLLLVHRALLARRRRVGAARLDPLPRQATPLSRQAAPLRGLLAVVVSAVRTATVATVAATTGTTGIITTGTAAVVRKRRVPLP